jgi:DinB family
MLMATRMTPAAAPMDLGEALVSAFMTNERVNQTLIELIAPSIWRVFPPCSKRRNIATSFAHIHNVRCMRLKMSDRSRKPPGRLDRAEVTIPQAKAALGESARAMARLIRESLAVGGRVEDYRPDVVSMVCAAINHEAHHRGQIAHWARELGAPLQPEQQLVLWDWHKLWKSVPKEGP